MMRGNAVRVDFVNPFVDAARSVLEQEVAAEIKRGALALRASAYTTLPITVLVAVTGKVHGIVLYSMTQATALNIVSTMMGQPFEEFDELAQSGIAEMGNVITGSASTVLAEAGYAAKISPPTLIVGNGVMISTLDIRRLVVPLETQFGTIEVQIALKEVVANGSTGTKSADGISQPVAKNG